VRLHYLQHVPFEGLGSILEWANRRAGELSATKFFEDPAFPDLREVDLLVIMGGPMSVNDESQYAWLTAEKKFIRDAIEAGKAVLGVCLGAQLVASALGSPVYAISEKEIGWFPVSRTEDASASMGNFLFPHQADVFHWHGETFDLPEGASRLASSPACPNQAFQLRRRVIGLQFHLEVTPGSVAALVDNCRHELIPAPYIQTETEIASAPAEIYESANALMSDLLDYLVGGERT
jgi:GMP synthase-like glutamine amidotransferase